MAKTIDWSGDWNNELPVIENAIKEGEIIEINIPKEEWMRLRDGGMKELRSRFSDKAASRFQLLWTTKGRNFLFVGNGTYR